MHAVLKDLTGIQNYLGDIIVCGHSKKEHDERLQAVLQHLKDVGLQINSNKRSCGQMKNILFLGHIICQELCALAQITCLRSLKFLHQRS